MLATALACSACAVTDHLGPMFGSKAGDDARAQAGEDVTGSAAPHRAAAKTRSSSPLETDLVFARIAIVDVLKRGSKGVSAPWENPSSGARGTVTPIASDYTRDGATCRDFLASYVRQGSETWMQGEACRVQMGQWEVKSLKPWTRS